MYRYLHMYMYPFRPYDLTIGLPSLTACDFPHQTNVTHSLYLHHLEISFRVGVHPLCNCAAFTDGDFVISYSAF